MLFFCGRWNVFRVYCVCFTMFPLDWKDGESVDYHVQMRICTGYFTANYCNR